MECSVLASEAATLMLAEHEMGETVDAPAAVGYEVRGGSRRQVSPLGAYIIEEYTRRHHRVNLTALAEVAGIDRGTIYLLIRGVRADGTPVKQWPDTLRAIAHAIASGDSDPEASEWIYAHLMDLADYLPRVPYYPFASAAEPNPEQIRRESEARIEAEAQRELKEIRRRIAESLLAENDTA